MTKFGSLIHDDVIKWKHFPRYWPFLRGIHRSPVNSPHKGQWRGALMFSLICVWINGWVNNGEAGDLRRYRAHYDVTVMIQLYTWPSLRMLTHLSPGQHAVQPADDNYKWVFLTHWGRNKMATVFRRRFQMHFLEWKRMNFYWDFTEFCPYGSK